MADAVAAVHPDALQQHVDDGESEGQVSDFFLPIDIVIWHVSQAASSKDLAKLCLTCSTAIRLEPFLTRVTAEKQHGIIITDGELPCTLAEVHNGLDRVADRAFFDFTRSYMAAALCPERSIGDTAAPVYMLVDVGGGSTGYRTVAACPPACGDCWNLVFELQRGVYKLVISGWQNPHHGILDITLDNVPLTAPEGLDWYFDGETMLHTFPAIEFRVAATGPHLLQGITERCNPNALGAKYWMCLEAVRILPADEVEHEEAFSAKVLPRLRDLRPRRRPVNRFATPVLVVRAAAQQVVSASIVAMLLTGKGFQHGRHAAWCFASSFPNRACSLANLVCPCRRVLRR